MKKGKKIYLRAVEEKDLEELMIWRNNEDFKKHFREYRELNIEMQKKWFVEKVVNDRSTEMFSIVRIEDDKLLGCAGLCYINWVHRHADLSLYIGWEESYIDNEGYARETCDLLFDFGFNQLGLNKIWTEIYEFDNRKKAFYDFIGMKVDGILRENYFYDGKWWNSYILSILRDDKNKSSNI